jgi:hypothetical protein
MATIFSLWRISYGEYRFRYGGYHVSYGEYRTPYGDNRTSYGEYHFAIWQKLFGMAKIIRGGREGMAGIIPGE